ncbi:TolC family protein, partial [Helicobacter pylori]
MNTIIRYASLWGLCVTLTLAQTPSKTPDEIKQILNNYSHKNLKLIDPPTSSLEATPSFLSSPKETATTINQEIAKYHEKSDKAALGLYELLKGATTNLSLQAQELSVKQAMKNHTIAKAMFLPTLNTSYN